MPLLDLTCEELLAWLEVCPKRNQRGNHRQGDVEIGAV